MQVGQHVWKTGLTNNYDEDTDDDRDHDTAGRVLGGAAGSTLEHRGATARRALESAVTCFETDVVHHLFSLYFARPSPSHKPINGVWLA